MHQQTKPRIAFIGLGDQGGPMAERIATAYPLTVWARRPEVLEHFRTRGTNTADSVADVARVSDIFCICVLDDAGTLEVAQAALSNLPPEALLVVHSTVHPDTISRIALLASEHGVQLVDAPVSGGGEAARAGTLTVMVGAAEDAFVRCEPIFKCFAQHVLRLGDVGSGQLAKLVNNAQFAATMAIADEAMTIATSLGLDADALDAVIKASSARSFAHEIRSSLPSLSAFATGAALLRKDVCLLADTAEAAGISATGLAAPALKLLDRMDAAADLINKGN